MLKYLINIPLRLLDKILKYPEPKTPQTQMLNRVRRNMMATYRLEVYKGVFDVQDGNFERFLSVSTKFLAQIAERDRYYRAWLGLAFLLSEAEMKKLNLSPDEIISQIKGQWMDDLSFLPRSHFAIYQRDFTEIVLSSNLMNLAKLSLEAKKKTCNKALIIATL